MIQLLASNAEEEEEEGARLEEICFHILETIVRAPDIITKS
jgi:hypothetical protein